MNVKLDTRDYDLIGVGIGPFNLALAALADPIPEIKAVFFDSKPEFSWHPGMLLSDARLQVPFLADLVTFVDPTSRWSFLNYLREHDRLFPFYFSERFDVPRTEYDHYCRWVSQKLDSCRFGTRVTRIEWDSVLELFQVTYIADSSQYTVMSRNVILGVGTEPVIPAAFSKLASDRVMHTADYLLQHAGLDTASDITVVGSGQSGAEVFLDLLRAQPTHHRRLRWLTRSPAFAPMEYSKLGLEHFTPAYTKYFHHLPQKKRDQLIPQQWQLYKAISAKTISEIYDVLYEQSIGRSRSEVILTPNVAITDSKECGDKFELSCWHAGQEQSFKVSTEAIILATGYRNRPLNALKPLYACINWDELGRYQIDENYRVALKNDVTGGLYVQNAETHTHGVGTPDLGLGAHRAAVILNAVTGTKPYRLAEHTAFTTFDVTATAQN